MDVETGLYYYRARYYDAQLGRFLQVDPVGYEDQMNLYAYVGGDPVNKIDPSGESGCTALPGSSWQYVEVKTNFSPLLKGQIIKDRHITKNYHVVQNGPGAGGLVPPRNVLLVRVWLF